MARNQEIVPLPLGEFTQLTNADVTEITFQAVEGPVYIRATVGATQPDAALGGTLYAQGQGEIGRALADLVNLAGANRVWARPAGSDACNVYVDHA